MKLSYSEAYEELMSLMRQLEDDSIQLDTLAEKIKQARTLIALCENKLRSIEKEVSSSLTENFESGENA